MGNRVQDILHAYISETSAVMTGLPETDIARTVELLETAREKGRKVYTFGNGGSAASASHFASDLAKGAICAGKPRLQAYCLSDNTPMLTAWANDKDYDNVFSEQLENYIDAGDVAIGISGSGNSPNVLNGIRKAREKGATTVGLIGFGGGKLKDLVDIPVVVACDNMRQVEDIHLVIIHSITACLGEY
ncbi:SIS domain-containing protein [Chloroflexota bacterium]